jgi:predicted phosphodiesterase
MASVPSKIAGRNELLQAAKVDGLKPFTRYEYHIGAEEVPPGGAFLTAPDGPAPFRFVVYGDTRSYPDRHQVVCEAIAKEDPAFVVCTGDLVADGQVWDQWKPQFFDPARSYLEKATLWPVRGNHDGDGTLYCNLFDLPEAKLYYSFNFGNAHFVVLDTELQGKERAMLRWLKQDLAKNRAEWTFIFYHVPTFNVGGHTSDWGRNDYLPIFESSGVDFVVTGHSHLYERFLPIGPAGKKPIIHIVSGGGGAPPYEVRPSPILAGGIGRSELHYCVFDLNGDHCDMVAKRPDGSVMDRLSLEKAGGLYQPDIMAAAFDTEMAKKIEFMFVHTMADLDAIPAPGQKAQVTIRADRFPPGCSVTVRQAKDEKRWEVEPQKATAEGSGFLFEARAPADFKLGAKGFEPPLRVALTVEDHGRTYSANDVAVDFSQDTLRKAVPVPEAVDIRYMPRQVNVDGDLSEWAGIKPMPLPFDKKETSSLRFGWREDGLYCAVAVKDATVKADPDAPWGSDADSVDLCIEKDFARSRAMGENASEYVFSPAPESGPGPGHVSVIYDRNRSRGSGITCAWRPTDRGYALEFFIPAAALQPAKMQAGTVLGMNFILSDDRVAVERFFCDKKPENRKSPLRWGAVRLAK